MQRKEAASLIVSGLAIAGGILSASLTGGITLISPNILAEGLKAFGGVGGNLVANALQTKLIDNHPQDDVLKNGDLTRAIGSAIFRLCRQLAKDTNDKNDRKSLEKLSETPLETWENLILGGEYEEGYGLNLSTISLDEVSAEKSLQYVNAQADKLDEIEALTPQTWQNIIDTLCQKQKCSLSQTVKEELAAKLHKEFAKALRQVLIADFSKDGKAYASMQFRILGEILNYLNAILFYSQQTYQQNEAILALVISSNKKVEDLSEEVAKINQNSPKHYSPENKNEWKKVFVDFESFRKTLDKTYQNTEAILAIVKKILENQEKQSISKLHTQKFFPKNFPQSLIYFTGGEQVLLDIAEALKNHGTAAFADTHGVGKSSVAIEFAHRHKENYKYILFIRATSNEFNIYVSEIVKDLGFALPEDAQPEQRLAVLQEWLATKQDWLLLVDNVDDVDSIHKCGFNKPNGKVIYTANNDKIFKVGTQVKLPKLNDENAMLLLYKHWQDNADAKFEDIPEEAHPVLKGIAEKFGNHPFSMAFVGSYLAEEDESLEEFLKAYQSKEKNLLEKYKFLNDYKHEDVATAFLLRFEQISTPKDKTKREKFLSIAVKDYLKLSAYIGTDNIPEELLQICLALLHQAQLEFVSDDAFIKEIYKRFKPTSIFKRNAEDKTLSTHRIVQEIMRFQINQEQDLLLETLADVLTVNFESFEFINKEKVERYLTHVGVFLDYLERNKTKDKTDLKLENKSTAQLCINYARYFYQYGQYDRTEKYCILFKNICERSKNIDKNGVAASYNNLAELYRVQGRYKEAENLYKKVIDMFKKFSGENHPDTATGYNNLGLNYKLQGKDKEAEPLYKKALAIREETLGENHPDTATSYSNLSALYFGFGSFELAREYQQKSLNVRLSIFGENHPDVANSYGWLGGICLEEEKYQEALDHFYLAREIILKFLPKEHPRVRAVQVSIDECETLLGKK